MEILNYTVGGIIGLIIGILIEEYRKFSKRRKNNADALYRIYVKLIDYRSELYVFILERKKSLNINSMPDEISDGRDRIIFELTTPSISESVNDEFRKLGKESLFTGIMAEILEVVNLHENRYKLYPLNKLIKKMDRELNPKFYNKIHEISEKNALYDSKRHKEIEDELDKAIEKRADLLDKGK